MSTKNISIIVAVDENNGIGKNNQLLCHIPNDLKRFKEITSGHSIIMGYNTFISLPKRPLPNRKNIVLTNRFTAIQDCFTAVSIIEAVKLCDNGENFVIGGGSVYRQMFDLADKLYVTKIHHKFDADVFFPDIDLNVWNILTIEKNFADDKNPYDYSYITYIRKN